MTQASKEAREAGLAAYREWFNSQPTLSPYACCPPDVPVNAAYPVIREEVLAEVTRWLLNDVPLYYLATLIHLDGRNGTTEASDFVKQHFRNLQTEGSTS